MLDCKFKIVSINTLCDDVKNLIEILKLFLEFFHVFIQLNLQVLELAFLGPEVEEARADIEDILFLRLYKNVSIIIYHSLQ